ncbi:hypothetical protein HDU86_006367 [Geranomyces michiganensis]|nr:hypothetical protein HDU86_006367 [Geranomyces michiganensis]
MAAGLSNSPYGSGLSPAAIQHHLSPYPIAAAATAAYHHNKQHSVLPYANPPIPPPIVPIPDTSRSPTPSDSASETEPRTITDTFPTASGPCEPSFQSVIIQPSSTPEDLAMADERTPMLALRWTPSARASRAVGAVRTTLALALLTSIILYGCKKLTATPRPAARKGSPPIFLNPGGPGGSGLQLVRDLGETLDAMLHGQHDLVSFDPRGVGLSTGIKCFATTADHARFVAENKWLDQPPSYEGDDERVAQKMARDVLLAEKMHSGELLRHLSTASVARDMDLLRQVLGLEKIYFWGFSYGTFLGAVYANLFPQYVGRMILDGVADPEQWSGVDGKGNSAPDLSLMDVEKVLDGFGAMCEAAGPSRCALADVRSVTGLGVAASMRAFVDKLIKDPLVVPPTATSFGGILDATQATKIIYEALYKPRQWSDVARAFDPAIRHADPRRLWTIVEPDPSHSQDEQEEDDYEDIANAAVRCTDHTPISDIAYVREFAKVMTQQSPLAGPQWSWAWSICIPWNVTASEAYRGPWNAPTKNKLLVIGNIADPATPLNAARSAARLMNAHLLVHRGYGHCSTAQRSACTARNIREYLANGETGTLDHACDVDEIIFP